MKKRFYILLLVFVWVSSYSQLLPSIGLNSIPNNSTAICTEPLYLGSFYSSGYQRGNLVNDFKLYSLNGDSLILSQVLAGGKPVLLIAGSLTCPVFRNKIATINQVATTYSNAIKVYVIYTLEAHPTDTSVYFGYVNITSQNTSAGILFPQPKTYGQRKSMVDTMQTFVNLNAPVFIDGPCNNWWKNFGPAPNNSYYIGLNGLVISKHGWFSKSPDNIFCDLDSILNINSGLCVPTSTNPGNFTLDVLNNTVSGAPGDLLYDFVDIINTSSVSTNLFIKKLQKSLPANWQTAFCADVCYGVNDDSIQLSLAPFDTLHFSLDFFTSAIPDSGSVRVGFRNVNKTSNGFAMWLRANTFSGLTGVEELEVNGEVQAKFEVEVYPNPAREALTIKTKESSFEIRVYDSWGNEMMSSRNEKLIDCRSWEAGIYFLEMRSDSGVANKKVVVNH